MNLRWKIALASAFVALVATTAVGVISYRSTSARLVDELDRSIASAAGQLFRRPTWGHDVPPSDPLSVYTARVLDGGGETVATSMGDVPVTDSARELIGHPQSEEWATTSIDGKDYRIYTIGIRGWRDTDRPRARRGRCGARRRPQAHAHPGFPGVRCRGGAWAG